MVETMTFFGKTPWHGLGTVLAEEDLYNLESTRVKAGLNWEVEKVPLCTVDTQVEVDHFAVRRKTDNKILGTVGNRFTLLQNEVAFNWFEPFLQSKEASLHTAGSLKGGSRIWILAKIGKEPLVITDNDVVEKFVLLSHGHDGSLSVRVGFSPIRVVCANTLAMAHGANASKLIRCKHSANMATNLENIRDCMNLANQEFEATAEQYRLLVKKDINQVDLEKYVKKILKVEGEEVHTRMKNIMEEVYELVEKGMGNDNPKVKGTYWAAYNGFVEYLSYHQGRNDSNRLNSLWFGVNANLNKFALDTAVEMAMAG